MWLLKHSAAGARDEHYIHLDQNMGELQAFPDMV